MRKLFVFLFLLFSFPAFAQQLGGGSPGSLTINGTTIVGGTTQGVLYQNSAGLLQNDGGLTYNAGVLNLSGGTIGGSAATPFLSVTGTWNTAGAPTAILLNVTNTLSTAGGFLLDLQIGGVSKFYVSKLGVVSVTGNLVFAGGLMDWNNGSFFRADANFGANAVSQVGAAAQIFGVGNAGSFNCGGGDCFLIDWATTANVVRVGTNSTHNMLFEINSVNKMDYGVTTAATWTMVDAVTMTSATIKLPNLASASGNDLVCFASASGLLTFASSVLGCVPSAMHYKDINSPVALNVAGLDDLRTDLPWSYRKDSGVYEDGKVHVGLFADDVERLDQRCVSYKDGLVDNYEDRCIIAYLVADRNKLNARIKSLEALWKK